MALESSEGSSDSTVASIFAMCAEKEGEEGGGVSRTKERSHWCSLRVTLGSRTRDLVKGCCLLRQE